MTYDHVFGSELSQEELYRQTAYPMLRSFLDGYNVTIMAYGQTGSGKSYTMGTTGNIDQDIDQQGLVPRFVTDLFENLKAEPHEQEKTRVSYKVRVSFIEVYIEDIYDLLSDQSSSYDKTLQVREDDLRGVYVFGQTETEVNSSDATMDLLHFGLNNRRVGETNMNATSSRSHAIFTVMLEQTLLSDDDVQQIVTSKLSFVDLAGSERCKRTGAEGQRKKEGIEINRGLSALGMVILALTKDDKKSKHSAKKANNHVPYRNCKLTHLLKDALGGNSQTLFLACVSPADSNSVETENTLRVR